MSLEIREPDAAPTECLRKQVEEIEALHSMYSEGGCIVFDGVEREAIDFAKQVLEGGKYRSLPQLSGVICLPDVTVGGQPISLRFCLPHLYPMLSPTLQVECNASRETHGHLVGEVRRCAEENAGAEVLILAANSLEEAVQQMGLQDANKVDADWQAQAAGHSKSHHLGTLKSGTCRADSGSISRQLIWFHHILNTSKRKAIVGWGADLHLGGYSVPGQPGIVMCEGAEQDVEDYVRQLRSLRWQAMTVRYAESQQCAPGQSLDALRRFACKHIIELPPEGGLSQLGQLCEAAGLQHVFLSALKITK